MSDARPAVIPPAGVDEGGLRGALYRFIMQRLRDPAASEDIVQETYVRLYDYRRTRPIADVGAFCFTVARNLANDHLRRRKSAPTVELPDEIACSAPRADDVIAHRQRVETLQDILSDMPPLRREVFVRRRLDGQSPAMIASELGLSVAAVEKHLVRAVADLHVEMTRRAGLGRSRT
ncbi:MAG: sigma-70 family RNA polymerase sigma factor, partial [Caulobacteraceae bacterium]